MINHLRKSRKSFLLELERSNYFMYSTPLSFPLLLTDCMGLNFRGDLLRVKGSWMVVLWARGMDFYLLVLFLLFDF
jgi:hypothetical protein